MNVRQVTMGNVPILPGGAPSVQLTDVMSSL